MRKGQPSASSRRSFGGSCSGIAGVPIGILEVLYTDVVAPASGICRCFFWWLLDSEVFVFGEDCFRVLGLTSGVLGKPTALRD